MPAATCKIQINGLPTAVADAVSMAYTEAVILWPWQLATASTDTAMSMGSVTTIDVLYLKSDQAITVNFDLNTGTDITVDANKPLLLTGTAITAVYISNASGSTANIYVIGLGA